MRDLFSCGVVVGRRRVEGWRDRMTVAGYEAAVQQSDFGSLEQARLQLARIAKGRGLGVVQLMQSDASARSVYSKAYHQKRLAEGFMTEERRAAQRERSRRHAEKVRSAYLAARSEWISSGRTEEFVSLENYRKTGRVARAATVKEIDHANRAHHRAAMTIFGLPRAKGDGVGGNGGA